MEEEVVTAPERDVAALGAAEPKRARFGRPSYMTILVAILVAAVLAEAVLLFRTNSDSATRADVLQVSTGFLSLAMTYNPSTLDRQRADLLAMTTGRFHGDIQQVIGSEFQSTTRASQVNSKGTVTKAAVTSLNGDTATTLCLLQFTTTNKDRTTPRVEEDLVELSLVHTSSGWKIDAATILGTVT